MRLFAIAAVIGLVQTSSGRADSTLYQDLGGSDGVQKIVSKTIDLYMSDASLRPYFDNINSAWLKRHFTTFVCQVADGPCVYKGRDMAASHRGLHIDERAFDRVVEDLQAGMDASGVPFWTQNRLLARLAPMERQIVTR